MQELLVSLQEVLKSLLQLVSLLFHPIILIPVIVSIIVRISKNKKKNKVYKNGAYYQITKLPYTSMRRNKGYYGEYLIYKYLKHFEAEGAKFLFNVYIPKENDETTEIDVLMICKKGVFVFESKNYSGWIFGSEDQKNWYQTLHVGGGESRKEHFYNPIMQNRSHMKHLKALLGSNVPMRSVIVFSDRCKLMSVQIKSNDIIVINRYNVDSVVSGICNQQPGDLLSESDIETLYNKLYPYTQVNVIEKEQHIANIHSNLQPKNSIQNQQIHPLEQSVSNLLSNSEQVSNENAMQAKEVVTENNSDLVNLPTMETIVTSCMECENLKCPKCSGRLVLRTAKKGVYTGNHFYGCSNYPKCTYIQNIPQ